MGSYLIVGAERSVRSSPNSWRRVDTSSVCFHAVVRVQTTR